MSAVYPEWYERYPVKLADPEVYFSITDERAGRLIWDTAHGILSDPEGIQGMRPDQVLACLFDTYFAG